MACDEELTSAYRRPEVRRRKTEPEKGDRVTFTDTYAVHLLANIGEEREATVISTAFVYARTGIVYYRVRLDDGPMRGTEIEIQQDLVKLVVPPAATATSAGGAAAAAGGAAAAAGDGAAADTVLTVETHVPLVSSVRVV